MNGILTVSSFSKQTGERVAGCATPMINMDNRKELLHRFGTAFYHTMAYILFPRSYEPRVSPGTTFIIKASLMPSMRSRM